MTSRIGDGGQSRDDLARELTSRITAIAGVRGLFPSHTLAAVVLTAVASTAATTAQVAVDLRGGIVRVTARVATDRHTSTPEIIDAINRAVVEVTGDRPTALRIELAHID